MAGEFVWEIFQVKKRQKSAGLMCELLMVEAWELGGLGSPQTLKMLRLDGSIPPADVEYWGEKCKKILSSQIINYILEMD